MIDSSLNAENRVGTYNQLEEEEELDETQTHHHSHEEGHHSHEEHHHHDKEENHKHHHAQEENVNVRAAFIHILGDIIQSIGVLIAAIVIFFYPKASVIDPICTMIFSVIVFFTTIKIIRDCLQVLMEGTPKSVNPRSLKNDILAMKGVKEIHDLHVWSISVGKKSLTAHIKASTRD